MNIKTAMKTLIGTTLIAAPLIFATAAEAGYRHNPEHGARYIQHRVAYTPRVVTHTAIRPVERHYRDSPRYRNYDQPHRVRKTHRPRGISIAFHP